MSQRLTVVITREEEWYVAHCLELDVVSQGKTIDETQANIKEAVELYLESFPDQNQPTSAKEVVLYQLEVA
jgi:predicted RNase H-like HicB family nuclease